MDELDPFKAIISVVHNSELLQTVAMGAGLNVNLTLTDEDNWSERNRLRALLPRVLAAHAALTAQAKLIAARAAFATIQNRSLITAEEAVQALERIGWAARDNQLVVETPDLREMFFPRGSQWDAFVVLRNLFAEAQVAVTIVDPYCDGRFFELLQTRDLTNLNVRILCSPTAATIQAESQAFLQQFTGVTMEVRRTRDFHDRFVVLDGETCVHIGASLNRAGNSAFMVSRVEDAVNRDALLAQIESSWNAGTLVTGTPVAGT